jgi:peptidoglycan/LPS O-acetylase OafA/YrhL
VLALATPYLSRLPRRVGAVAIGAGLAVIVGSAFVIRADFAFPTPWAAGPCGGAALIIAGGLGAGESRVAWPLTNSVSRYIGRISYSLYLWHWPVLIFLAVRLTGSTGYLKATELLTMLGLSVASYHFVEAPLVRLHWRDWRRESRERRWDRPRRAGSAGGRQERYAATYGAILLIAGAITVWTVRPMNSPPSPQPAGSSQLIGS